MKIHTTLKSVCQHVWTFEIHVDGELRTRGIHAPKNAAVQAMLLAIQQIALGTPASRT